MLTVWRNVEVGVDRSGQVGLQFFHEAPHCGVAPLHRLERHCEAQVEGMPQGGATEMRAVLAQPLDTAADRTHLSQAAASTCG